MNAFASLVAQIAQRELGPGSRLLSATTYGGQSPQPPLFAAHLILDGREYILSLVPTDLGDRGAALQEGEEPPGVDGP